MTGIIAAAGALLWSGARCAADGTVLAARLRKLVPSWRAVAASAACWFVLGERLETAHSGVPLLAVVVALALAAWLVLRLASIALRALAGFVFAIVRGAFNQKRLSFDFVRREAPHYAADDKGLWWRRFSRPPPVTANA